MNERTPLQRFGANMGAILCYGFDEFDRAAWRCEPEEEQPPNVRDVSRFKWDMSVGEQRGAQMRTTTTGMERSLWGALCAEGSELAEEADRRYSTRVPSDTHWTLWDQFVSGFCDQAQRLLSNGFTPYISITQSRILVRFTRKFKHPTPVEFTVEYVADDAAWRWALDSSLNPSGLFQMSDSVEETTEWAIAAVVDWEERIVHMRFPHNPTVPNGRAMAASAEFAAACESEGWTTFTPRVLACVDAWNALMVSDQRPDIEALIAAGFSAHVIPNRRKGKGARIRGNRPSRRRLGQGHSRHSDHLRRAMRRCSVLPADSGRCDAVERSVHQGRVPPGRTCGPQSMTTQKGNY